MATVAELISENYIDITPEELQKLQNPEWIGQMRSDQEGVHHLIFIHDGKKYRVTKRIKITTNNFKETEEHDKEIEETEKKPFAYTIGILKGQVLNLENNVRKFKKKIPVSEQNIARKERVIVALEKKIIEVKSVIELLNKIEVS